MRKLVAWNLMSLDGYFEGAKPWDLDFHNSAWGDRLSSFSDRQLGEIGTVLFGRATYEGMAAYWSKETGKTADFMNATEKMVASRTLKDASWQNSRVLEGDLESAVRDLKAQPGRDIYVFGSAKLISSLLELQLVDEYRVCICPILLGSGTPLFKPADRATNLKLVETNAGESGGVILFYVPDYAKAAA